MMKNNILQTLTAALILAVVCTAGDLIWSYWQLPHKVVYGITHGGVMCLCIGAVLGVMAAGKRAGMIGAGLSLIAGSAISGGFYPLYSLLGTAAMFVCWMLLWLAFAWIHRYLAKAGQSTRTTIIRGLVASILSGAAFYPIYELWANPPEQSAWHLFLAAWFIAFLPGFGALLIGTSSHPNTAA